MAKMQRIARWGKPGLFCLTLGILSAGSTSTGSQNLVAAVRAAGSLSVPPLAALTSNATKFKPFTGGITLTYRARTSAGGGGHLTLRVTSDFAPTGGPSVAAGALSYTCAGATLGAACSGTQTASTSSETPVLMLPAAACTGGGGGCSQQTNSVDLTLILPDDPGYATGVYSAKITFTISAM